MVWLYLITAMASLGTRKPTSFAAAQAIHLALEAQMPTCLGTAMPFLLKNQVLIVLKDTLPWVIITIIRIRVPLNWICK